MIIKINEAELLAILGENGEHWVKKIWYAADGSVCLHGAIRRCQPIPGDAHLVEQVAECQGWGPSWNDDDGTTWPMVRERAAHIEVTDADLADTFGPQWQEIVTLVRRAAVLTDDEAQRLAAARAAAPAWAVAPARAAAWAAARDAAPARARAAAWAAGRDAAATRAAAWAASRAAGRAAAAAWEAVPAWVAAPARAASRDAARDAAQALAVRDLIGLIIPTLGRPHGFTQAHYDTLTMPWRTVIGRIHPDDPEVKRG
jgi:hypothetical protein